VKGDLKNIDGNLDLQGVARRIGRRGSLTGRGEKKNFASVISYNPNEGTPVKERMRGE